MRFENMGSHQVGKVGWGLVGDTHLSPDRPVLVGERKARSEEEKEHPRTPTHERCERAMLATTDLSVPQLFNPQHVANTSVEFGVVTR